MDRDVPPLDEAELRAEAIDAGWRRLDVVAQTGSTNADLLARAESGIDIGGAVLIAEHQTAGRGRHSRVWSATPRAQITMSVGVSTVDVPTSAWGWLSLATGVAVVDAVSPLIKGAKPGLKWPNDVLVDGGKLAGILAEVARPASGSAIVIGIGLNVAQAPEDVAGATSLLQLGVTADRQRLVGTLLRELGRRIAQWRRADAMLAADYRARSLTIGSRVRAQLPAGDEVVGTATGIDARGQLCLDSGLKTGSETGSAPIVISAGDVVHLR
jgi:BirA family transcriptional regulator, biotin operon repressor / biotin---[acetyl-CoA-carboxylase] ligase